MYVTQKGERYGACVSHTIGPQQQNVKFEEASCTLVSDDAWYLLAVQNSSLGLWFMRHEIDQLVYKLHALTSEEIAIVEKSTEDGDHRARKETDPQPATQTETARKGPPPDLPPLAIRVGLTVLWSHGGPVRRA